MATTGIMNSTLFVLSIGGVKITHLTNVELTFDHSPRDTTTKDSAGYREQLEGLRSFSGSGEAMFDEGATYGLDELYTAWENRTALTAKWGSAVSGDTTWSGTVYIENVSVSSPSAEDNVTYSVSFTGTGQVTKAVNP